MIHGIFDPMFISTFSTCDMQIDFVRCFNCYSDPMILSYVPMLPASITFTHILDALIQHINVTIALQEKLPYLVIFDLLASFSHSHVHLFYYKKNLTRFNEFALLKFHDDVDCIITSNFLHFWFVTHSTFFQNNWFKEPKIFGASS